MKKTIKAIIFTVAATVVFTGVNGLNTVKAEAAATTTKSTTKVTKKVVKLKRKAKRRTVRKVNTKKITKRYNENNYKVVRLTTIKTTTTTKFAAKKKTIRKVVKTTVKTTKELNKAAVNRAKGNLHENDSETAANNNMTIDSLNGTVNPMIIKAFKTMNYTIEVNPSVSYAGFFDGRNQKITLRSANRGYLLHELGHYVSFITGFKDSTAEFKNIYKSEAAKFTGTNKAYVTQNNEEYFAESFRDFYTRPAELKSARPATYNYIVKCINSITDDSINTINAIYYL